MTAPRTARGLLGRRYADLPVRAKLLVPFAVLMVVWGGFGTYVLARGTAGEARGRATARLAEALDGARAEFADDETSLLETVRLAARTEGIAAAISAADVRMLRRYLLPVAVNAGHDELWAVDRAGRVLLRIDQFSGRPAVGSSGSLSLPGVLMAARGDTDARGDKHVALTDRSFLVAGPVRDAKDRAVGAIAVGERLSKLLPKMGRGTRARVVLFSTAGRMLASSDGGTLPHDDPSSGLRASVRGDDGPREALYASLEARGETIGHLSVALPASVALAGVRGTATTLAALVGFAVLAAVGIGLLTSRAITRPLSSLLRATRALEQGDLGARAHLRSADEVGTLSAAFDRMAGQLQASHADLERKVAERTAELERVNHELARASEAKSAFLASMSHELRTPLHAIIGFGDMLSDPTFGRHDTRTTRDLASNIVTSGRHLLALINDALDLAKVEAGKIEIDARPLDLTALLSEFESTMRPLADQKRISLRMAPSHSPPAVLADPARLRQVLFNLLANAIKFTPEGGTVALGAERSGAWVTVSVSDTGPGLAKGEADRIFEPYERGRAGRGSEGVGLGLALARRLVELQGGRIWARRRPGAGSTFSFTIPVAAESSSAAPRARVAG
ncbi:MAG: HAMP domain-containing protein [Acidobacteria bacterium]|nr:HAMP domain-containing protein [Acidobacteriota bacterium]